MRLVARFYIFYVLLYLEPTFAAPNEICSEKTVLNSFTQNTEILVEARILQILTSALDAREISIESIERLNLDHYSFPELKNIFKRSTPLYKNIYLKTLEELHGKRFSKPLLGKLIQTLVQERKTQNQQLKQASRLTIHTHIPLNFFELNMTPIQVFLDHTTKRGASGPTPLNERILSSEILLEHRVFFSHHPITGWHWLEVMGALPKGQEKNMDAPLQTIEFPSVLIFLNQLSKAHGLQPAYDDKKIFERVTSKRVSSPTGGLAAEYALNSVDEMYEAAARNRLQWRVDTRTSENHLFYLQAQSNIYSTRGYRLPTLLELATLIEKTRQALVLKYPTLDGAFWPTDLSSFVSDHEPFWIHDKKHLELNIRKDLEIDPGIRIGNLLGNCPILTHETTEGAKAEISLLQQGKSSDRLALIKNKHYFSTNKTKILNLTNLKNLQLSQSRWMSLCEPPLITGSGTAAFIAVRSF